MSRLGRSAGFLLALFAAGAGALAVWAQGGSDVVRVTVTVTSRDHGAAPPALAREDVMVRQDNERRPVVDWVPAQGEQAGLDLALLIDDSADASLGNQFRDLQVFLRTLPRTTRVAVAYSRHGSANWQRDFSADHELAVKALRLPVGSMNDVSSVYQSMTDLVKKWPKTTNRSAILLISDGIDLFRGVADSEAGQNMDLEQAIDHAQRSGITVYALFASGAARYRSNWYLVGNGQSCLLKLAKETGGEAYFQGWQTPVAFQPFLQSAAKTLEQQYLLTFRAQPLPKPGFARLHVSTEVPRVEMTAPARVYVPSGQ